MKIPKKIRVGGHTIKIIHDHKTVTVAGVDDLGDWDGNTNTIILFFKDHPDEVMQQVFLHELLHAVIDIYSGGRKHITDEDVESISQGMYQVFTQLKGE